MNIADFDVQKKFKCNRLSYFALALDKAGEKRLIKCTEPGLDVKTATAELKLEYDRLQLLDSTWVMPTQHFLQESNQASIVYQPMAGQRLSEYIQEGKLSFSDKLHISIKLTEALRYLHKERLLHRHVCPESFWVSEDKQSLYILDLSLVANLKRDGSSVRSNQLIGDVHYASPELTGRSNLAVDGRSDLYSLGAILYELFSGHKIFAEGDQELLSIMYNQLTQKAPPLIMIEPNIPVVISHVVSKLLEKSPDKRYQSSSGLLKDLKRMSSQWQKSHNIESFPIASQDSPEGFRISQKLYGREQDIKNLLSNFDQVATGSSELVLIGGYSGVGKSALVKELQIPITRQKGLYTFGKCDQFNREEPYTVFVQALRLLMRQLLSLSDVEKQVWQVNLKQQLENNAGVIDEIIPELSLLFQEKISAPEQLGLSEGENRFQITFSKFVHAIARPENPLVIFLDDLQWADQASLILIEQLMEGDHCLMIIGAYRDNEVDKAHPLSAMISRIDQSNKSLCQLTLKTLSHADVLQLIADSFWLRPPEVEPLAKICMEKTEGNPFFVNQFLLMLNDEEKIYYDFELGQWRWHIEKIESMSVTSNVVDLMLKKFNKFSDNTLEIARNAANLGNQFTIKQLVTVMQKNIQPVFKDLSPLIEEGLILPLDENYRFESDESQLKNSQFAFLHDRVQQAAYQLISPEALTSLKWHTGLRLLNDTQSDQMDERLFGIVEQLNAGIKYAQETNAQSEIERLVHLNVEAATKAKRSSAYALAQSLLLKAKMLVDDIWGQRQEVHSLRLDIYNSLAEVSYMIGEFELAETLYPQSLTFAQTALEQVAVYAIQTAQYQIQGRFNEAIILQKQGLATLGIKIPDDDQAIAAEFMGKFERIGQLIENRQINDLLTHTEMSKPEHAAAMQLLWGMWYASYLGGQTSLNVLSTNIMTEMSLEFGHNDISAFAYVNYALAIIVVFERYQQANEFGHLAIALADKRENVTIRASVYFLYATFTHHWNESLQQSLPYFDKSFDWALQAGDLATLGYICAVRASDTLARGVNLNKVHNNLQHEIEILTKHKQQDMRDCVTVGALQSIRGLLGLTNQLQSFDDEQFSEARFLADYSEAPLHLAYFYNAKIRHAYLTHDEKEIQLNLLEQTNTVITFVPGQNKIPECSFYSALILLKHAKNADDSLYEKAKIFADKFVVWANVCKENFEHKSLLIKAELARVSGDELLAINCYGESIEQANKFGYMNIVAVANECFATFCLQQGQQQVANSLIVSAYEAYRIWGATGKMLQLQAQWPSVIFNKHHKGADDGLSDQIELQSMQKLNQIIANEIQLDSLLEKLMNILIKNAGADWSALIRVNEDDLWLEALGDHNQTDVLLNQSLQETETQFNLPTSIVRYVQDTQALQVFNRPFEMVEFTHDVYFQNKKPLSIVVIPVIHQGKMIAIVYLENLLNEHAFNQDHISLLNTIASQAAVSLSHAFLYESLEKRVFQRTEELAKEKVKAEEATVAKSRFLANMSHEIRSPMNAVIGFTRLALRTDLTEKQRTYLDKTLNASNTLLALINNILDFSKIEALELKLEAAEFNLDDTFQNVIDICSHKADEKSLTLELNVDANVPRELIGDSLRLQQILINLVANAIKFTEIGKVNLQVKQIRMFDDKSEIQFSVIDSGIGINSQQQKRLFNSFYQVDESVTRKYGGTGLGLAICKQLTELMGGQIRVESEAGEGSSFIFAVSFKLANKSIKRLVETVAHDENDELNETTGRQLVIPDLSQFRILLAEDNLINLHVARDFLSDTNVLLEVAENGLVAIEYIKNEHFDLVLMDIQMPEMDGLTASKKIREFLSRDQLPIIAMTSHAMEGDAEISLEAGMNEHITKPVGPEMLYSILSQYLNSDKLVERENKPSVLGADVKEQQIFAALNTIEQINVRSSIQNLQGKTALYLTLVEDFWRRNRTMSKKIDLLNEGEKWQELELIAHTLKSTGQYIGAMNVVKYARQLEQMLKQHNKKLNNTITLLQENLNTLIQDLNPIFQRKLTDDKLTLIDLDKLSLSIIELRSLSLSADKGAKLVSKELCHIAQETIYAGQIENIHGLISDLEFESALVQIRNLELNVMDARYT